ncbi:MAG: hypothetical protein QOJ06_1166 [Pseudonocardiales bacterium]|nr:hypothetical protein [Pseudonocardiales bacterium]
MSSSVSPRATIGKLPHNGYRGTVVRSEPQPDWRGGDYGFSQQGDAQERQRLHDDLIGLDRDDPEVRAFSEHLDRTHRVRSGFTVEGYLSGVSDFAESVNRAEGPRRLVAVLVVVLILLGVAVTLWQAATFVLTVLLG